MQTAVNTGTVSVPPFQLPYIIEGNGQPAIVVGSSKYYPRAFSKNLRNHLRFVFMDHRGMAPSPGQVDTSEFELDKIVDDIEILRQQLGLGRIMIIGHSGQSYMALEYGKKYPENTSHVVMIGIAPNLGSANAELAEKNYQSLADSDRLAAEKENMRAIPEEKLSELPPGEAFITGYIRNAARIWYDPRYDCTPLWEGVEINMDMFEHVWGKLFAEIDITQGLEDLQCPVFLALGRYDFIVAPPSSWDPVKSKFKNLTLRIFEKSGHTPQFEEPELFDKDLLAWMNKYPS